MEPSSFSLAVRAPDYSGDGSFAKSAKLNKPIALAIDKNDTVYFVDSGNNRVRKVGADGSSSPSPAPAIRL